uniref:Eukaryotic translation initiation factor 4E n=1 Tax=viral metagenome TaxID=1070528 RepID=A0A6C0ESK7_9ZZZZ
MTTETPIMDKHSALSDKWKLWAHLPHNTDWSIKSYIDISTFTSVEDTIAITETLPAILVENCMLFVMREGIKPTWEDPKNRNGGCFSYRVSNKNVYKVWKDLTYVIVGGTISKHPNFVNSVTGITISPKKSFCIIKIWMSNCLHQNPGLVTPDLKGLTPQGCLFKKHTPEY